VHICIAICTCTAPVACVNKPVLASTHACMSSCRVYLLWRWVSFTWICKKWLPKRRKTHSTMFSQDRLLWTRCTLVSTQTNGVLRIVIPTVLETKIMYLRTHTYIHNVSWVMYAHIFIFLHIRWILKCVKKFSLGYLAIAI